MQIANDPIGTVYQVNIMKGGKEFEGMKNLLLAVMEILEVPSAYTGRD